MLPNAKALPSIKGISCSNITLVIQSISAFHCDDNNQPLLSASLLVLESIKHSIGCCKPARYRNQLHCELIRIQLVCATLKEPIDLLWWVCLHSLFTVVATLHNKAGGLHYIYTCLMFIAVDWFGSCNILNSWLACCSVELHVEPNHRMYEFICTF